MAADLRFCLAGPLQLVARRNEKSSAELSRFLAKQVSGRPLPFLRAGLTGAAEERKGRTRTPLRRHLLPAAL